MNIRKSFAIAVLVSALCCWSFAKTQDKDKDSDPNGNVKITAGPTVNTTSNSATIQWTTNGDAANIIHYGTDANNLSEKHYQAGGSKDHSITLDNLQPGTTYYFAIMTDDKTVRRKGQFTTQGAGIAASATTPSATSTSGPGTAQIISGPSLQTLGSTAAIVQWRTALPSSSFVKYGTDKNNLNQAAEGAWASSVHMVRLSNLKANTLYYMQALSSQTAASGNSKSQVVAFTTLAPGAQARNEVPVTPVH